MLDTVIRAIKGATRSPVRTTLVVLLLAVGLSFALTSVALAFAADDELEKVKATTGVEAAITINPGQFQQVIQEAQEEAQANGEQFDPSELDFELESLTSDDVDAIEALPYVRNAEGTATSSVQYSIPGQEEDESESQEPTPTPEANAPGGPGGGGAFGGNFSPPDATITGVDDAAFLDDFQDGTKAIVDGRLQSTDDEGKFVVVVDQNTATLEGLAVGDTVTLTSVNFGRGPGAADDSEDESEAPEIDAEIIGIYQDVETASEGGFGFTIEEWYAPLSLISALQEEDSGSDLTSISVVVDSVDDFSRLRNDLASIVDPDAFALTTSEDSFEQIAQPIQTMRNTSLVVMFVGLAVVGVIMIMLMIIVMRGRLREIGILKAIGAKSRQVVAQFALETVGVAVVAVTLAIPSVFAVNTFLPDLIRPSAEVAAEETGGPLQAGGGPGGGPGGQGGFAVFGGGAQGLADPVLTEDVEAALDQIDASVSADVIAIGAAVAIALGLLGTAVTLLTVLRQRPAEVLRLEG